MLYLGQDHLVAFDRHVDGQLFWNFRNELEDRWNYVTAYDKGWISPSTSSQFRSEVNESAEFL